LKELEIEGMHLNIIEIIYDRPITSIILNKEKLKLFPLKSEMRQVCPLSPFLFSVVLKFLSRTIRQQKEIRGIKIRKEVKLSLFTDGIILYLKDPKDSTKNLLDLINTLGMQKKKKINNFSICQQ
jgi:hypothetical protein